MKKVRKKRDTEIKKKTIDPERTKTRTFRQGTFWGQWTWDQGESERETEIFRENKKKVRKEKREQKKRGGNWLCKNKNQGSSDLGIKIRVEEKERSTVNIFCEFHCSMDNNPFLYSSTPVIPNKAPNDHL